MTQEEAQRLLDEASSLYNDGQYDDAITLWNQVLAMDPQNARALEGIKMADLLLSDWVQPTATESAAPSATPPSASPSDAGFVDEQLALARHYTMLGDVAEAGAACRRVLEIDAGNVVATELLATMSGAAAATSAASSAPAPAPARPAQRMALGAAAAGAHSEEADLLLEPLPLELGEEVVELPPAAPAVTRSEDGAEGRIASLLEEGNRCEQEGRYQDAIDTWSRIFVLQDAHPDAELRMDRARRALEQQARRMEEHLARGEELAAAGRIPEALDAFRCVLEIRFEHAEARRRIAELEAKLNAGPEAPAPPPPEPRRAAAPPPPPPDYLEEEGIPSRLPTPPPVPSRARPAPPRTSLWRSLLRIGGATLTIVAVLAVVGYFAWQKLFPPSPSVDPPPSRAAAGTPPAPVVAPPAAEPAPAAPLSVQEVAPAPPPAPAPVEAAPRPATADAGEALRLGVEAFRAGDFEAAKARFDEALRAEPSNFEATDWASKTQAELDKRRLYTSEMTSIRQAFAQHDYRGALYKLYRVEAPGSADRQKVNRWIADCWFDWGVESLQAGRLEDAEKSFKEARDARPDDREAAQHLQVLERYRGRPVDATLEAYAARLTLRPLE